jgi:hypothetical protein
MMTMRQIERFWSAKSYARLSQELLAARQEAEFQLEGVDRPCFVAALAMIRMDELSQSYVPLFSALVRVVVGAQERDGGWGDPATTSLCVRALLVDRGEGVAIDAGLRYLANLQKEEGIWPSGPLRRMPADPAASLFVLYQLGDNARFRQAVRFADATAWFKRNESTLSQECRNLFRWAGLRWRMESREVEAPLFAA